MFSREVQEECGLTVLEDEIDYMGIIDFEFKGDPVHMEVHVFLARRFQGWFVKLLLSYNATKRYVTDLSVDI